jgi:hypothetical protein
MNTHKLNGRWRGQFTYGNRYEEKEGVTVPFELDLQFDGNVFTGTAFDQETKHLFSEPAKIEGVFSDNYISFIKKYPCSIEVDQFNRLVAIKTQPAIPVHYTGTLRKRGLFFNDFFEGEWEVTSAYKNADGTIAYATGLGTWTMKR